MNFYHIFAENKTAILIMCNQKVIWSTCLYIFAALISHAAPEGGGPSTFSIVNNTHVTTLTIEPDEEPVVRVAAQLLISDVEELSSRKIQIFPPGGKFSGIIAGTLGASDFVEGIIRNKHVDVSSIRGKSKMFHIEIVLNEMNQPVLLIIGSDRMGTAYGIIEISRQIALPQWRTDLQIGSMNEITLNLRQPMTSSQLIFQKIPEKSAIPSSSTNEHSIHVTAKPSQQALPNTPGPSPNSVSAPKTDSPQNQFFVQLAATNKRSDAQKILQDMTPLIPFPLVIVEEGGWFKIRAGGFDTLLDANKCLTWAKQHNYDAFRVRFDHQTQTSQYFQEDFSSN